MERFRKTQAMTGTEMHGRAGRLGRYLLGGSLAAAIVAAASPVMAQVNATGSEVFGTGGIVDAGTTTTVTVTAAEALVDWSATDANVFLPDGSTLAFDSVGAPFTVLNRISPVGGTTNPLAINGAVTAISGNGSGSVWFYNPNGFVIGDTSSFDVNGLVLSASPITSVDAANQTLFGASGEVIFGQTPNPDASVTLVQRLDSEIGLTLADSYLAIVAPRIVQDATVNVNGSVAYVAAEAATISVNGGLFDITVDVGTTDANGIVHTGDTYGDQPADGTTRQYLVAVPKNDVLTMLVTGGLGYNEAGGVNLTDGRVVLSAGYDIVGGAATGPGTAGASIAVSSLLSSSAIDASATNAISIDDADPGFGSGNRFDKAATFTANNLIDVDLGLSTPDGANLDADLLTLNSGGGVTMDLGAGAAAFIDTLLVDAPDSISVNVAGGSLLAVNGLLSLTSIVSGAGAVTAGDITLSVADGAVGATDIDLLSIAYSGTLATGGTVTMATTGTNASISTVNAARVWAMGFGTPGNPDGASGVGGTAQVLVQDGQMAFGTDTFESVTLDIRADGGPGVRDDATGTSGSAQGGTALLSVAGGDLISDWTNVYARGLSYILFDTGNGLAPFGGRQAGDGGDAIGGTATFELTAGSISSLSIGAGASFDISAIAYGSSAFGSTTAGGTGGTGQGGTARFLQSGGMAAIDVLGVDASGMGGAGSFQNVETGELQGDGGDGLGGTALVQLSGGTLELAGGMGIRADGNPRSADPVLGTQAGQGGSAFSGMGGTGGTGLGGDASLVIDGGALLAALDGNGAAAATSVTVSATGFGGAGGNADPFITSAAGGTGGTGSGGSASYLFAGGANQAANIFLVAQGNGGVGGGDLSGGSSGFYAGSDGGSGFGGAATFAAGADFDGTVLGTGFDQFVSLDATGSGASGNGSDTGDGGAGGDGTGGDVGVIADGAALTISGLATQAGGFGGNGGNATAAVASGGDGGSGQGGSIRLAALNGGSLTDAGAFAFFAADGYGGLAGSSASGTGGAGGNGAGGDIVVDALSGAISFQNLFLSASGYADQGGFGATMGEDGTASGGGIAITITGTGPAAGSLQATSLDGYAAGTLGETTTAGGTIRLNNASSGFISFGSLTFNNGYGASDPAGAITVIADNADTFVTGNIGLFATGLLAIESISGGLSLGSLSAYSDGDILLSCTPAPCSGITLGNSGGAIEAAGGISADGMIVQNTGPLDVAALGGDIALVDGAAFTGVPLQVFAGGSITGDGTLLSAGDLGLTVGGSVSLDRLLIQGPVGTGLTAYGTSFVPGTPWNVPGSPSANFLFIPADTIISAGGDIDLGELNMSGASLTLNAFSGAATVGTATGVQDLSIDADAIAFTGITTIGATSFFATNDVTGGAIDAGGDVSLFAGGDLTASSLASGGSIFVSVNSLLGLDSLSAPLDVTVFTSAGQDYSSITAGQNLFLFAGNGAIAVGDLSVGGIAGFDALSLDIGASGPLSVGSAFAYDGDIVITAAGALDVSYAEATGDVVLTSTDASVTADSLFAGSDLFGESGGGSQEGLAVAIPDPGIGNIAINAATDVDLTGTVHAPELVGVDAGGTFSVFGTIVGRLIFLQSADLVLGGQGFIGDLGVTEDISLVATGDAAIGAGAFGSYQLDPTELTRMFSSGDFGLSAGGFLSVGDLAVAAGDGLIGSAGSLFLAAASDIDVNGNVLLDAAAAASLLVDAGGFLFIDSGSGSLRVQSDGVQAGSLFLYGETIVAGSGQNIEDITGLPFADLTDALGLVGLGDGRSLIEGGSLFVDAAGFYVANTGASTEFDARRGILANSMTVVNSAGDLPFVVVNGVVDGSTGLDTAFRIGFPTSAAPYSSVNGCYINFGAECGPNLETELVKKIITEEPPHSVLDGEPRSSIETRIVTIDKIDPEGFEPLIDEPVTGTGNDDLWEDEASEGRECPLDARQDECEEQGGD